MLKHQFAAVFPARAGMIPSMHASIRIISRIPRESGDDPDGRDGSGSTTTYSPRERG